MKIFTKTLLFFISLILLEAVLSISIITNIVEKNYVDNARNELGIEAAIVYENYNSWKRNIWKKLIFLKEDEVILRGVRNYSPFAKRVIMGHLYSTFIRSGIDYVVMRDTEKDLYNILSLGLSTLSLSDVSDFKSSRLHPYIEINRLKDNLAMIGVVRFEKKDGGYIEFFLIKMMNKEFCKHLTLNQSSYAAFFINNDFIFGSFEDAEIKPSISVTSIDTAYGEFYNVEINRSYYNIASQMLENIAVGKNSSPQILYLVTFLSNQPYIERLNLIKKTALYVTLNVAFLTIILSLFFSKNITNPIKALLNAMYNIKNGRYDINVRIEGKNEISKLFEGFNEMAEKLGEDKKMMEKYINEIMILNEYNEKIIHSIHAGIIIVDTDFFIKKVNRFFLTSFGYREKDLLGNSIMKLPCELVDDVILKDIKEIVSGKKKSISRIKGSRETKLYEVKLYPLSSTQKNHNPVSGCILVFEDISKKVELEEKIFHAEKLSSLSMLSAGVAHEINNPLGSIMTNVQNLLDDEREESRRISLKYIEQETRRIAKIIQELLTFSSVNPHPSAETDVNEVILQVVGMMKYAMRNHKQIVITSHLAEDLPMAKISGDELKQVVINLMTNSMQAIEKKGVILVKSWQDEDNKMINIVVQDNGRGIPSEHISKIFDPFFTTKQNGEGTGLGLSIVYGIVKKYGGSITIKSAENKGTLIKVSVPALL